MRQRAIWNCNESALYNIPVKSKISYLGIPISKNQQTRCSSNFNPIIEKTKRKVNQWLLRDLGRILITKAEGISRLTLAALALELDNNASKEIDRMLFNFLWKNKSHHIKKPVMMNPYERGGLNCLDFATLNRDFKINWIRQFLRNPSIRNMVPHHVLYNFGGLNFLPMCNYNIDKIPVKLSAFHCQAFLSWSLIYKHNFSPRRWKIRTFCTNTNSSF